MADPDIDDVTLLTSALSADLADLNIFLEVLAQKLEGALPSATVVEYQGGLFGRNKKVRRVAVTLGDLCYAVARQGNSVIAQRSKVVRGISLKNDQIGLDVWVGEFSSAMAAHLQQVSAGREALERMLLS
jgi:hypothetical protein